ncbi:MAG: CRISPR-associated endonuclease Csy4 [Methyloprofundus sp.]|nr:MAG: CRISPR-associated endonuclease Csy4 [Methyloprofundus sp.]
MQLEQLDIAKWLNRLTDYTHATSIKSVPPLVNKYACFKRKSVKSELRKSERLANHLNKSVDEILEFRKNSGLERKCKLPFIHMESQKQTDTGKKNKFRLFIAQELFDSPVDEVFDCYGLSKAATVPCF